MKGGETYMTMKITKEISLHDISSLLVSAFEGGSNNWYMIEKEIEPQTWEYGYKMKPDQAAYWYHDYPLNPGGALIISDMENKKHGKMRLDKAAIQKGLEIMAAKYPYHFGNFIAEEYDAITGDVFLQCCLFGDVIYG